MSGAGEGRRSLEELLRRPAQVEKTAPCQAGCAAGGDPRSWLQELARHRRLGHDLDEARRRAWLRLVEANPFPASVGRICPHPCESGCNRDGKDGAVAVHEVERHLGDWALEQGLALPRLGDERRPESVAVVGAGPAGLSFAYQMARRGHPVVVYESAGAPGGMLLRGVPEHRLPASVLQAEIDRVLELGVELRLETRVGVDLPLELLRERHAAIFLGVGAQAGRRLGLPGEEGGGCWTGTDYLRAVNEGRPPALGERVVVVGGGNTAIDAARCARRAGARVSLAYRRTRAEMPALDEEIDEALEEGVALLELVAPLEVLRGADGAVRALRLGRMRLGEPDESGRRRPEPVPGDELELAADAVIAAVAQVPDWTGLAGGEEDWARPDALGSLGEGLWTGGDDRGLAIAGLAIGQGRIAAEALHAKLTGAEPPAPLGARKADAIRVRLSVQDERPRSCPERLEPAARLADPDRPVTETLGAGQALAEAERCLSCGSCIGCEQCALFCNAGAFTRLEEVAPGAWFALDLDACEGCGKCIEVCPCGYLELRR